MDDKKSLTLAKVLSLGAINGLIVGLALEKARQMYVNYQMSQAAREYAETEIFVDFIEARWNPLVPVASMVTFAVVACLIYKCFLNRPRLLLMIWFLLGLVALSLGFFMSTSSPNIFSFLWLFGLAAVAYLVHRLWKSYPKSQSLLWATKGISAVIVVAAGVQLVGLFFYWPDLRRPILWLIFLVGVIAINAVFGAVVGFFLNRAGGSQFNKRPA